MVRTHIRKEKKKTEIFLRFKIIYFLLFIELYTLTLVCLIRKIFAGAILITKITFLLLIYFVKSQLRMKTRYLHFSCYFFCVHLLPFTEFLLSFAQTFVILFFFLIKKNGIFINLCYASFVRCSCNSDCIFLFSILFAILIFLLNELGRALEFVIINNSLSVKCVFLFNLLSFFL